MRYDSIVVGAGSAGGVLATRLSEDPRRSVLLLEAGPDYADFEHLPDELKFGYGTALGFTAQAAVGGTYDWDFTGKLTDSARRVAVPAGKVVGGTSAINGQVFLRGIREDYDSWASTGNDGWAFQDILQYFRRVETDTDFRDDFHGTDGPIVARRFKRDEWLPVQQGVLRRLQSRWVRRLPRLQPPRGNGSRCLAVQQPGARTPQLRVGLSGPGQASPQPDHPTKLHPPPSRFRGQAGHGGRCRK